MEVPCRKWRRTAQARSKTKAVVLGALGPEVPLSLEYTDQPNVNGFTVKRRTGSYWDPNPHLKCCIAKARAVSHSLMALRSRLHLSTCNQWLCLS